MPDDAVPDDAVFDTGLILQGNPVFAAYVDAHPNADPDKVMQMFFIDHPEVLIEVVLPALRRRAAGGEPGGPHLRAL